MPTMYKKLGTKKRHLEIIFRVNKYLKANEYTDRKYIQNFIKSKYILEIKHSSSDIF